MKQECPTYLKTIGKSKALAATLSDTEPEDDSKNKDDGILNAFTDNFCRSNIKQKSYFHLKIVVPHNHGF